MRVATEVGSKEVLSFLNEYSAAIRPVGLDPIKVLPPSAGFLRTFLWSRPAPDAILNDVVRLSLYSDQVVVVDPFSQHVSSTRYTPGERGPWREPAMWVQHFVNWGLLVCALEPWIASDLVVLIPEPENFILDTPAFEAIARQALADGLFSTDVTPDAVQDMLEAAAFTSRGEDELRQLVPLLLGELRPDEFEEVVVSLKAYQAANPTRYAPPDPAHASLISHGSGQNVFEAGWIAEQVGGYLVPRGAAHQHMFQQVSRGDRDKDSGDALASAFAAAKLPMLNNVSLATALELRKTNRLAAFRTYLHDVWAETVDRAANPKAAERERALVDRLVTEYSQASEEWSAIYKGLGVKGAVALFATPLAPVIQAGIIPAAATAVGIAYRGWSSGKRALHQRPAALLVDLENESSPNPIRRIAAKLERRL